MTKTNKTTLVALALIIPGAISLAGWAESRLATGGAASAAESATAAAATGGEPEWVASAPGRVEAKSGDIRIGANMIGRVAAVLAEESQKVSRGDILIQIEDEGASARFQATKIDAARAKKDRDDAGGGDSDYRTAEDDIANAEIAFWNARDALDRAAGKRRNDEGTQSDLDDARKSYVTAETALASKRNALVDLQGRKKRPNPNRQESGLAQARSEQSIAAALVEKTHIRAPIDGTVLKLDAKVGEIVAATPDQVLVIVGDTSSLRVKAELDERDVGRIKVGQQAIVRADAFQGQDFTGRVSSISPALTTPGLRDRGAARRTDVDVLDIKVDLDPNTPLIPGLRVDVFFKAATEAAAPAAAGKDASKDVKPAVVKAP
jgi:HlyD family secretion protein